MWRKCNIGKRTLGGRDSPLRIRATNRARFLIGREEMQHRSPSFVYYLAVHFAWNRKPSKFEQA